MNEQSIKENWQGNMSRRINMKEDITISGIGGRFPMSDSTDEFAKNLYDNVDMISEDVNGERWPKGKLNFNYFTPFLFYGLFNK